MTGVARATLMILVVAACAIGCSPSSTQASPTADPRTGITGHATAGPVCPVERVDDPACDPRPVAGAEIFALDASGAVVGSAFSDAGGAFTILVPPGRYVVEGRPVTGVMGTPSPVEVVVDAGSFIDVELGYDTGIR